MESVAQCLFGIADAMICITSFVSRSSLAWSQDTPVSVETKWTRVTTASRLAWSVTMFASATTPNPAAETAGSSSLTVSVNWCCFGSHSVIFSHLGFGLWKNKTTDFNFKYFQNKMTDLCVSLMITLCGLRVSVCSLYKPCIQTGIGPSLLFTPPMLFILAWIHCQKAQQ